MKRAKENAIRFGPLGANCIHLCIDMQRLFGDETEWNTPWMPRVIPKVRRICDAHAPETIFTRFLTLARSGDGEGTWRRYYERWRSVTTEALAPGLLDLVQPLQAYVPPAVVLDKYVYSPWFTGELDRILKDRGTDTVVVTGGETDVCVLGTVLGAVDRGLRTIVVTDALCSSSDETHEASMMLYRNRYGQQVETVETDLLLEAWTG